MTAWRIIRSGRLPQHSEGRNRRMLPRARVPHHRVHSHDRARVAHDERPDDRAEEHADRRDEVLGRVLRGDVAVADRRERVDRPVERRRVPTNQSVGRAPSRRAVAYTRQGLPRASSSRRRDDKETRRRPSNEARGATPGGTTRPGARACAARGASVRFTTARGTTVQTGARGDTARTTRGPRARAGRASARHTTARGTAAKPERAATHRSIAVS